MLVDKVPRDALKMGKRGSESWLSGSGKIYVKKRKKYKVYAPRDDFERELLKETYETLKFHKRKFRKRKKK